MKKLNLTEEQKSVIKGIAIMAGTTAFIIGAMVLERKAELNYLSKQIVKRTSEETNKEMFNAGRTYALRYIYNNIPETRQPLYDYSLKNPKVFTVQNPGTMKGL